jgi:hypothetical protein
MRVPSEMIGGVDLGKLPSAIQQAARVVPEAYSGLVVGSDWHGAVQAAMDAAASAGTAMLLRTTRNVGDELKTSTGLRMEWAPGAWLMQTGFSTTGSFLTNLRNSSADAATIQDRIELDNPQIDGTSFPAPIALVVASATATTVTFTSAAPASNGALVGYALESATTPQGGVRIVTGYVGATRTATHSTAWSPVPVAGDVILAGWNDNAIGFAAGVSGVRIKGGRIKGYAQERMVPAATGGKGINLEQGVTRSVVDGTMIEGCGTAIFFQGMDGSFANGATKRATGLPAQNIIVRDCGSLFTAAGINTAASPDGDSADQMVRLTGFFGENVGHSPWRLVGSDPQKSGIINLLEAQNVQISHGQTRNDSGYPASYPTDYPTRCGYGLSGPVGALVWGHGRNIQISDLVHSGNLDNLFVIRRGRALGDDAGPTGAPRNCYGWSVRNIEHFGALTEYVIRIDPTAGFRVAASEFTGTFDRIVVDSVGLGICDPNMAAFTGVVLDVTERATGKRIIGTPAQIIAAGNSFASFDTAITDMRTAVAPRVVGRTYVLADDTAMAITPPVAGGMMLINAPGTSLLHAWIMYEVDASPQCSPVGGAVSNLTTSNSLGVLTGTTGSDGFFTVSAHTDGKIYLENRRGGTVTFTVTFHG